MSDGAALRGLGLHLGTMKKFLVLAVVVALAVFAVKKLQDS